MADTWFDDKQYKPFLDWFTLTSQDTVETGTPSSIVSYLEKNILNTKLGQTEKQILTGLIKSLPKEYQATTERGPLLQYMNLLPMLDSFIRWSQTQPNSRTDLSMANAAISNLRASIQDSYINIKKTSLSPEMAAQLGDPESDEFRKAVLDIVMQDQNGSPLLDQAGTRPQGNAPSLQPNSPDPVGDLGAKGGTSNSNIPNLEAAEASIGYDPNNSAMSASAAWETYLRQNPDSTILDLIQNESLNTQAFSDAFRASEFLRLGGDETYVVTSTDGKQKVVNARSMFNLIYDLEEDGKTGKIKEIQEMLREAGYYQLLDDKGMLLQENPYTIGVADEGTAKAWAVFLGDAARMNIEPSTLFKKKKEEWSIRRRTGLGLRQSDPNTVFNLITQLGVDMLGRDLSEPERMGLYGYIRKWEREAATQFLNPGPVTDVDIESRIRSYIGNSNRQEVQLRVADEFKQNITEWFGE